MLQTLKTLLLVLVAVQLAYIAVAEVDENNLESTLEAVERLRERITLAREKSFLETAKDGDFEEVGILLTSGVKNVNLRDEFNNTALLAATVNEDILNKFNKYITGRDNKIQDSSTALKEIQDIQTKNCKMLLDLGADVSVYNRDGDITLLFLLLSNNLELFELLLNKGAQVNAIKYGEMTLLHAAATADESDIKMAELLVRHGANLNARNADGYTPLGLALRKNDTKMIEYLQSIGATE